MVVGAPVDLQRQVPGGSGSVENRGVGSTLRGKFQQSSACARCLSPVHRQRRGLRLSAKVTHMRHFCVFLTCPRVSGRCSFFGGALHSQQLLVVEGSGVTVTPRVRLPGVLSRVLKNN